MAAGLIDAALYRDVYNTPEFAGQARDIATRAVARSRSRW
jgi:hypothetical protein